MTLASDEVRKHLVAQVDMLIRHEREAATAYFALRSLRERAQAALDKHLAGLEFHLAELEREVNSIKGGLPQ